MSYETVMYAGNGTSQSIRYDHDYDFEEEIFKQKLAELSLTREELIEILKEHHPEKLV